MDALPDGHEIGGYRIVRVAGRGAVGVVYEARHVTLGKRVAIKTLNRLFASESEFRARFDREAQGAASVDHPNITAVFDAGEQGGVPYLVMTYVDGPDLERILEHRGGPIEPAEAILICRSVADALDAAAELGLAHRDVKPANILLEDWDVDPASGQRLRPHVYLTDFGLTKHNAAETVTRTGQFVGTLLYMAPEQIEGHAVAASDQYSLACVLWECLVGTPPFVPSGGSNLSLLTAHLSDPVPPISARSRGRYPVALDSVFAKALHKKADKRYASCVDFVDAAAVALGLGRQSGEAATSSSRSQPEPDEPEVSTRTAVISSDLLRDPSGPGSSAKSAAGQGSSSPASAGSGRSDTGGPPRHPTSSSSSAGAMPAVPLSAQPSHTPRPPQASPSPPPRQPPPNQPRPQQPGQQQPGQQQPGQQQPSQPQAPQQQHPQQTGGGSGGFGQAGPSGLPAGLSPQAYKQDSSGGSKTWLWVVLAVLVIIAIVLAVLLSG